MKRKGLAILLAFCLVISLVPVLASADNKDVSRTIDVENQNIRLSVVVGGRLTVSSSKSDKDGDYIWEEVSNDSIVEKIAMKSGKDLILEGLRQGTAKFKLIVGNNETTFQVQVLSDEQGVSIVPDSVVVAVDGEKPLTASYSTGTIYERDDADFTWGSLKPSIADVDENGVVTGVAKGVTTVTAQTYQDGKLWSGACTVMVEDPHTIKYVKSENGELTGDEKIRSYWYSESHC